MGGYTERMKRQFAARFAPPDGSGRVPLDVYTTALHAIEEGLASLRHVAAPRIARRHNRTVQSVRDALVAHVLPSEHGSNVVPFDFGPREVSQQFLDLDAQLASVYWHYNTVLLRTAARGEDTPVTATGADAFARAGEVAHAVGIHLELAERRIDGAQTGWKQTADLGSLAPGLRRYANTRRDRLRVETQLFGRIIELIAEPLGFGLRTENGRVRVRATAALRDRLRTLWGKDVMVQVTASVDRDGVVNDPVARDIDLLRTTTVPLEEYRASRGAGRGLWSTEDAQDYLDSLRWGNDGS
jgi:hypothetical protein